METIWKVFKKSRIFQEFFNSFLSNSEEEIHEGSNEDGSTFFYQTIPFDAQYTRLSDDGDGSNLYHFKNVKFHKNFTKFV